MTSMQVIELYPLFVYFLIGDFIKRRKNMDNFPYIEIEGTPYEKGH